MFTTTAHSFLVESSIVPLFVGAFSFIGAEGMVSRSTVFAGSVAVFVRVVVATTVSEEIAGNAAILSGAVMFSGAGVLVKAQGAWRRSSTAVLSSMCFEMTSQSPSFDDLP